jgi:hypothetical protein
MAVTTKFDGRSLVLTFLDNGDGVSSTPKSVKRIYGSFSEALSFEQLRILGDELEKLQTLTLEQVSVDEDRILEHDEII